MNKCRDCGTTEDVRGWEDPRSTETFGDSQYPDAYLCSGCAERINSQRRTEQTWSGN